MRLRKEKIYLDLTRIIPRKWLYWIAIRIGVIVTTGKYGKTIVSDLTFMDAVKRLETNES